MTPGPIGELRFEASASYGKVSALLLRPPKASALLVLGHGAGAGMRHVFMEGMAESLAQEGVATFRYQFPYMEKGGRRPDPPRVLMACVRAAVLAAAEAAPDLPLFAGGKSLGGRMTSNAAAKEPLPGVRGLVYLGFPLHPAGKLGTERADHLQRVTAPMLFLQGTRDRLADMGLLKPVLAGLAQTATLYVVDTADHGFKVLKRAGKSERDVWAELARAVAAWIAAQ